MFELVGTSEAESTGGFVFLLQTTLNGVKCRRVRNKCCGNKLGSRPSYAGCLRGGMVQSYREADRGHSYDEKADGEDKGELGFSGRLLDWANGSIHDDLSYFFMLSRTSRSTGIGSRMSMISVAILLPPIKKSTMKKGRVIRINLPTTNSCTMALEQLSAN
jgi:hypothetical protein